MLGLMIVPLIGLLITLLFLAIYYCIKRFEIHDNYDEIENPLPRTFTVEDVKSLCLRHRKLSADIKDLQDEGFAALDFLNRMKGIALIIDPNVRYLDDDHEIFTSAYFEFKRICASRREAEHRAIYEKIYKEKLCETQIKILELLPPQMFCSHSRFFLPPSPINRVNLLVDHVKMLRAMSAEHRSTREAVRKRRMTPSQLHYHVKEKKARIENGKNDSFDEAKMRILSMAYCTKKGASSESIRVGVRQAKPSRLRELHHSEVDEKHIE